MLVGWPALGTETNHVEMVSYRVRDNVVPFPLLKISTNEPEITNVAFTFISSSLISTSVRVAFFSVAVEI